MIIFSRFTEAPIQRTGRNLQAYPAYLFGAGFTTFGNKHYFFRRKRVSE